MQTVTQYTVEVIKDTDEDQYAAIITNHTAPTEDVRTVHLPDDFVSQIPHYLDMLKMMR